MDIELFNFLRKLIETEDGLILYALALIVIMEIVDFASGTFAAIVNPDVEDKSRIGINGLIRKVLGIFMLLLLIQMSVLLPEKTGFMFLYSIYIGYLVFTFQSLIENYQKVKGNILLFKPILKAFEHLTEGKSNDDKENNHGS